MAQNMWNYTTCVLGLYYLIITFDPISAPINQILAQNRQFRAESSNSYAYHFLLAVRKGQYKVRVLLLARSM